jgi:hypothetical protein
MKSKTTFQSVLDTFRKYAVSERDKGDIPDEKWFAKKYKPFFIGITDSQWFAINKIRKPLAIEYKSVFLSKTLRCLYLLFGVIANMETPHSIPSSAKL